MMMVGKSFVVSSSLISHSGDNLLLSVHPGRSACMEVCNSTNVHVLDITQASSANFRVAIEPI